MLKWESAEISDDNDVMDDDNDVMDDDSVTDISNDDGGDDDGVADK